LTTRVQVRRSLDKAEFYGPAFSLGYSAAVTAGIIKSISEENTLDTEAVVALFANELKDRTVRSIKGDAANSVDGNSPQRQASGKFRSGSNAVLPTLSEDDDGHGIANNPLHAKQGDGQSQVNGHSVDKPSTSAGAAQETGRPPISPVFTSPFTNAISNAQPPQSNGQGPPLSRTVTNNSEYTPSEASFHTADSFPTPAPSTSQPSPSAAAATAPSGTSHGATAATTTAPAPPPPSTAPRLLSLSEGMPEYYVQCAVQTLIFDTNTSEGNTRKIFIDKFKSACIVSLAQNALTSAAARGHMQAGYTGGGCSWLFPGYSVYVGLLVLWRACDVAHRSERQQQYECAQEREGGPGRHAAGGAALHRRHARVHPQQPRGVAGPAVRAREAARHDPADPQRRRGRQQ
jgi:hypothetical protein